MGRVKNKNINYPNCPRCKSDNVIKHNVQKGLQRYRCKSCGRTFFDKKRDSEDKYERNTKRVLSLLMNLLDNNFFKKETLQEALKVTDKTKELSYKVLFDPHLVIEEDKILKIGCYKPKLLICHDEENIVFIQIPTFDKKYKHINNYADNKIKVEFEIIDSCSLGKNNKQLYGKPLKK